MISRDGCPTPTGTPCPALPHVPMPGSNIISFPTIKISFKEDGPSILKEVSMVGNDMMLDPGIGTCGKAGQGVPVGVGQPSLLINNMTVGGTQL